MGLLEALQRALGARPEHAVRDELVQRHAIEQRLQPAHVVALGATAERPRDVDEIVGVRRRLWPSAEPADGVEAEDGAVVVDRAGLVRVDLPVPVERHAPAIGLVDLAAQPPERRELLRREPRLEQPVQADRDGARVVPLLRRRRQLERPAELHGAASLHEQVIADVGPPALEVPAADDGDFVVRGVIGRRAVEEDARDRAAGLDEGVHGRLRWDLAEDAARKGYWQANGSRIGKCRRGRFRPAGGVKNGCLGPAGTRLRAENKCLRHQTSKADVEPEGVHWPAEPNSTVREHL